MKIMTMEQLTKNGKYEYSEEKRHRRGQKEVQSRNEVTKQQEEISEKRKQKTNQKNRKRIQGDTITGKTNTTNERTACG